MPSSERTDERRLVSVSQAAGIAGVSRSVAYRWARAGQLPGAVLVCGRWWVRRRVLVAWLNGQGEAESPAPFRAVQTHESGKVAPVELPRHLREKPSV